MEVYRSKDGHVAKYVHDDGSETSIKTTPEEKFGGEYGSVKNKFNVFISTSVGCPVGCKFCYLTTKKCPYHELEANEIIRNVVEAIKSETDFRPALKNMYAKLSWMGMGDAYVDSEKVYWATAGLESRIRLEQLCAGIDGIDIATTLPKIPKREKDFIQALHYLSLRFENLNPERNYNDGIRTPLRVFYSLHATNDIKRKNLIPHTRGLNAAFSYIKQLRKVGITVIFHHMFFDSINDEVRDVSDLLDALRTTALDGIELRVLRFNRCEGTTYKEADRFDSIIGTIHYCYPNVKVQSSPGSEVKAACGQFLLSKIKNISDSTT